MAPEGGGWALSPSAGRGNCPFMEFRVGTLRNEAGVVMVNVVPQAPNDDRPGFSVTLKREPDGQIVPAVAAWDSSHWVHEKGELPQVFASVRRFVASHHDAVVAEFDRG